jgi:hypothetical protein
MSVKGKAVDLSALASGGGGGGQRPPNQPPDGGKGDTTSPLYDYPTKTAATAILEWRK